MCQVSLVVKYSLTFTRPQMCHQNWKVTILEQIDTFDRENNILEQKQIPLMNESNYQGAQDIK